MHTEQKFSERLRTARKKFALSQSEMADELKLSHSYIHQLEAEKREPSPAVVSLFEYWLHRKTNPVVLQETAARVDLHEHRLMGRALLISARKRAGLTAAQLARRLGYSSTATYLEIEEGRSQMGEKMARKAAEVLGVPADDLMAGADHPPENGTLRGSFGTVPRGIGLGPGMEGSRAKFVPLISMAQAGLNVQWTDEGYTGEGFLAFDPKDKDAFAVRITGDSMLPNFAPGDVALLYPNEAPKNDGLVVAILKEEAGGGVMFKIYHRSGDLVTLSSYNERFAPQQFRLTDFAKLIRVAGVWKNLL